MSASGLNQTFFGNQQDQAAAQTTAESPADAGKTSALTPQQFGPNNEDLPEDLQSELLNLILQTSSDSMVARRYQVLKCRKARYYWQGVQNIWFDFLAGDYRMPYQGGALYPDDKDLQEQPRYDYVVNVYLPFGLAFLATFAAQGPPTVIWTPRDANRVEDVTFAKSAQYVGQLIEDNNQMQQKMLDVSRLFWTDGIIGAYVRYVTDKERYGESEYVDTQVEYVPMGEDMNIDGEILRAPRVPVPSTGRAMTVANGQVRIDFYGGLELGTPVWANEFWDFPWLKKQSEVPDSRLKAMWPNAAKKIEARSAPGAEDLYARIARLAVQQGLPILMPGDALAFLNTYTECWIRPWHFQSVTDEQKRNDLLALFPDGAYVAFAGQTYCGSRNEAMAKHWRICHAFPGDGQNRPAVGEASLELQDQINVLSNQAIETFDYSIPPVYADPEVLDFEALTNRTVEPGVHVPAKAKQGQALANGFFQPEPATPSQLMLTYLQELIGPMFQLLTGISAAVFGGQMEDVKTAKAYQQARDMSLGRIGTPWQRFKAMYAEVMQLAVECYRENAVSDAQLVLPGGDSGFDVKAIKLTDLNGNALAQPQTDETYPQQRSQKTAILNQLMALKDPQIAALMSDPSNVGTVKRILGLDEFTVPGEDARQHQLREIEGLLHGDPTVAVRPLDDHEVHIGTIARWAESDAGQQAAIQNPQGYAAIEQHAMEHKMAMAANAMPAQPATAPTGPALPPNPQGEAPPPEGTPV